MEVIWQASYSSLSKEFHVLIIKELGECTRVVVGQVDMGGDSRSKGHAFEYRTEMLDGWFATNHDRSIGIMARQFFVNNYVENSVQKADLPF